MTTETLRDIAAGWLLEMKPDWQADQGDVSDLKELLQSVHAQGRREGAEEAADECDRAAEAHERAALNSDARQKRYHRDAAHEIRQAAKAIRALPTSPEDAHD